MILATWLIPSLYVASVALAPGQPVISISITQRGVALVQDYDGDSVSDLVLGVPSDCSEAMAGGRVVVVSTKTWQVLKDRKSPQFGVRFGGVVAVLPDLDEDKYNDFIVGSEDLGQSTHRAWILSGRDLTSIREYQTIDKASRLGSAVGQTDDIDGDGLQDYFISDPGDVAANGIGGTITVFSSRTGAALWTQTGGSLGAWLGRSAVLVGDLDGDCVSDILATSNRVHADRTFSSPGVVCYSGKSGSKICQFTDPAQRVNFGLGLYPMPDVNADGTPDFAIGTPDYDHVPPRSDISIYSGAGRESLYSFRDMVDKWNAPTEHHKSFPQHCREIGLSFLMLSDLNADRIPDWISGDGDCSCVWICSGLDGKILDSMQFSLGDSCGGVLLPYPGDETRQVMLIEGPSGDNSSAPIGIRKLQPGSLSIADVSRLRFLR